MKKIFVLAVTALSFAACQQSLEEKAAEEARLYTEKNCPAKIAENLISDSLTFEANSHTLHYYYTIIGASDTVGVMNLEEARQQLLEALKNTTSMKAYKDEGYLFAYTYHSQKHPGTVIFETVFSKQDYATEQ